MSAAPALRWCSHEPGLTRRAAGATATDDEKPRRLVRSEAARR